jgi:hypothetical protein
MPDVDDLWGADFHPSNAESKPVTLLKKQAELLGERTEGRVQGIVKQNVSPDGTAWASLYARVPSLKNYEHKLISISYPVASRDPVHPFPLTAVNPSYGDEVSIDNMEAFRDWLSKTLSSGDIRSTIENLMRFSSGAMASASLSG